MKLILAIIGNVVKRPHVIVKQRTTTTGDWFETATTAVQITCRHKRDLGKEGGQEVRV